jgi:hypothetical protein
VTAPKPLALLPCSFFPSPYHQNTYTTPSTYQGSLLLHLMSICLIAGCLLGHFAELCVSKWCLLTCSCHSILSVESQDIFNQVVNWLSALINPCNCITFPLYRWSNTFIADENCTAQNISTCQQNPANTCYIRRCVQGIT